MPRLLPAPFPSRQPPLPSPLPQPTPVQSQYRVSRACDSCRSRRSKCSGERPQCHACSRSGQVCIYSEGRDERLQRYIRGTFLTSLCPVKQTIDICLRATQRSQTLIRLLSSLRDRVPANLLQEIDDSLKQTSERTEDELPGPLSATCSGRVTSSISPGQAPQENEVVRPEPQQNHAQTGFSTTTAMEILWFLQTQPIDAAREALNQIRNRGALEFFSDRTISTPNNFHTLQSNQQNPHDENRVSLQRYDFYENFPDSHFVTISTVRRAVAMYFKAPGLLFHVINEGDAGRLLDQAFENYEEMTMFRNVIHNSTTSLERARLAEIAGMAAVGLLYLYWGDHQPGDSRIDAYFYNIARQCLDDAIGTDPLRAMKVCAFIALYNMVVKARVAIVYIGKSHAISHK
jgi:hypothetical protein